ncbi:microbial aspartic proteinase [Nemania sp. FL0916]|nr:microbial aspartic proteinase [Nemania sp. FL0916]
MVPQPTLIAFTAALAGLATASPVKSNIGTKAGSFTVHQVRNNAFKPHGAFQLAKAYNKYGITMPEGLAKVVAKHNAARTAKRSSGSVNNKPEDQYDNIYLAPVAIGTPPKTLNLEFDSGSADSWVFSTRTYKAEVNGQTLYNPDKSSTAKAVDGASWNIIYGDGSSASGTVYHDVVNIGGVSFAAQGVQSADQVSDAFTHDTNSSGLLGLAFSDINTVSPNKEKTFFENVLSDLDVKAWTADLKYNAPGTYDFGKIDKSKYNGDIAYVDVDKSQGFWNFTADINGQPVPGIADTGTAELLLPDKVLEDYYSKVQGAIVDITFGGWVFPCDAKLPDFEFHPGTATITIPGKYLNFLSVDLFDKHCFGGLQSVGDFRGGAIYGDIALKAAFVVFDQSQGAPRLGWASKNL